MPCNHQLYGFTNSQIHKFTIHKSTTSQPRISHLTYHIPHPESQLTHFTSSQLHNFTASQIHKFTNSRFTSLRLHNLASHISHHHIITSPHHHIITSPRLHKFTNSQIHDSQVYDFTTSHLASHISDLGS